jgi:hypothetical protein
MKIVATALIITFIITLIVAVIIIQENTITTTQIQNIPRINSQSMIPNTAGGGGSTNTNTNTATKIPNINNMRLTTTNKQAEIYWEVPNGIGCCNGYNCNAQAWKEYCITPFKLWELYLDNQKINTTNMTYTCNMTTPYNYYTIQNIPRGIHTLTIQQKECTENIVDTETIMFEVK